MSEVSSLNQDSLVKRYSGKIAPWWYAVVLIFLGAGLFLIFFQGIPNIMAGSSGGVIAIGVGIVILAFGIWSVDTCIRSYVEFYDDHIRVVFSFSKVDIPYKKITLAKETNNVLASLSASLDRIHLKYGYDEILIAVKDKESFLNELLRQNPLIQVERKANRPTQKQG